jgi:hypothetical protein
LHHLYIPQHHHRTHADDEDDDHPFQVLLASLFLTNVQLIFAKIAVGRSLTASVAVLLAAPEIQVLVRRD